MANLTSRDQKTIRYAVIGIAIYLALFFGVKLWKRLERGRADYQQALAKAQNEQRDALNHQNKVFLFEKLTNQFRFDPRKLPKETLVAEASAAIQNAARQGGIQLGPVRETPGRATSRELSSIQFDGMAQVPAALGLVHKLQTLGFPIVIESLQLTPQMNPPGMLKLNVTVHILNYDQWKPTPSPARANAPNAGGPNA